MKKRLSTIPTVAPLGLAFARLTQDSAPRGTPPWVPSSTLNTLVMNPRNLVIILLVVAAMAAGCKPSAETVANDPHESAGKQMEALKKDAQDTAKEANDYTFAQKADFTAAMQLRLAEFNRDLEKLTAKVESAGADAKAKAGPKLEALRGQLARLNKQLEGSKDATESTWGEVKAGFKTGCTEVKDGFQQARQWVSDKIAP